MMEDDSSKLAEPSSEIITLVPFFFSLDKIIYYYHLLNI
jgi:hypothetical protein